MCDPVSYTHLDVYKRQDEKEQAEWFYRFWVLKESFMKATRRGMGLDMRTYEFAWRPDGIPYMRKQPGEYPGI